MGNRSPSHRTTRNAVQNGCRELLEKKLGYKANVDAVDRRLHDILGKENARQVRQWCGGYLGANGKWHVGRLPRDAKALHYVFDLLIAETDPNQQDECRVYLARLCVQLDAMKPGTPSCPIVAMTDREGIVSTLDRLLQRAGKLAKDVRLYVVTSAADHHATMSSCLAPMVGVVIEMVKQGNRIHVKIIEQGARMMVRPDKESPNDGLVVLVGRAGDQHLLSWHGTVVAVEVNNELVPVGAIISWKGNYYVREVEPSDPNVERELAEKLADHKRAWKSLETGAQVRKWETTRDASASPPS
jgi:hypothetical protein